MSLAKLYLDEDTTQHGLVDSLRARRIDVVTTEEAGRRGCDDEDQLRWATAQERVIYTFKIDDFYALHREWLTTGRNHGGIVLGVQRRHSIGDQLRGSLKVLDARSAEEMRDRLEYLSSWY